MKTEITLTLYGSTQISVNGIGDKYIFIHRAFRYNGFTATHAPTGFALYTDSLFRVLLVALVVRLRYPIKFGLGDECGFREYEKFATTYWFGKLVNKYMHPRVSYGAIDNIEFCEVSADLGKSCTE